MTDIENWKLCPAVSFPLEVSDFGRVRTLDRTTKEFTRVRNNHTQPAQSQKKIGKILSPYITKNGYQEVAIRIDGVRKKYRVHRLVGQTFVDGHFDGATIDHKDGNKLNNKPENLEWVTLSENTRRQWETGLVDLRGELAPGSKLSNLQGNAIKILRENGIPAQAISEWFNVSVSLVYKIESGLRRSS
jgi:hypothetical protein